MTGSNKKTLLIIQIFITMKTNTPRGIKQKGNQLMRMGMEIKQWTLHKVAFLVHCFQVKLEFEMFLPREDGPREKPSKQGQEPTTNSTHMWCHVHAGMETQVIVVGDKCSNLLLCHPYSQLSILRETFHDMHTSLPPKNTTTATTTTNWACYWISL